MLLQVTSRAAVLHDGDHLQCGASGRCLPSPGASVERGQGTSQSLHDTRPANMHTHTHTPAVGIVRTCTLTPPFVIVMMTTIFIVMMTTIVIVIVMMTTIVIVQPSTAQYSPVGPSRAQ